MKHKLLQLRELAARNGRKLAAVGAGVMASPAFAALDTTVSTELNTAKTDVMAVGALVFGIAIGIVIYKWFRRAL